MKTTFNILYKIYFWAFLSRLKTSSTPESLVINFKVTTIAAPDCTDGFFHKFSYDQSIFVKIFLLFWHLGKKNGEQVFFFSPCQPGVLARFIFGGFHLVTVVASQLLTSRWPDNLRLAFCFQMCQKMVMAKNSFVFFSFYIHVSNISKTFSVPILWSFFFLSSSSKSSSDTSTKSSEFRQDICRKNSTLN